MLINPYNYEDGKPRIIKEVVDNVIDERLFCLIYTLREPFFSYSDHTISRDLLNLANALHRDTPFPEICL